MLFNTFQFLIFFLVVLVCQQILSGKCRKSFLLAASYYFYMCWNVPYVVVIWAITVFDFIAGRKIYTAESSASKRAWLYASIVCNCGLLFTFKYFDFFALSTQQFLQFCGLAIRAPILTVLLPVGISFHTFQALSYTIEVYRGRVPAERSLLNYALYVAFFPQMVAGPIERPYNLLPQFHRSTPLQITRVASGIKLVLWGLFKKAVIADVLAPVVARIYGRPHDYSGELLLLATVFFAVQIYCDFSGYSEMAVGLARILGYDLMINFKFPYCARTVGEFWRRWHISLSTWFRDYVYIPLGGSRVSAGRWTFNICVVFLLSGLWHGANWTFCAWGILHGLYIAVGHFTAGGRAALRRWSRIEKIPALLSAIQVGCTFALVTIAWVFFRSASVQDAWYVVTHLFAFAGSAFKPDVVFRLGLPASQMASTVPLIALLFLVEWCMRTAHQLPKRLWMSRGVRWAAYATCTYGIVFFGVFKKIEFIYFQF